MQRSPARAAGPGRTQEKDMAHRTWVYAFEQGDGHNKMLLGGKGANLCEMTRIGLTVPPGFVITTEACLEYLADSQGRLPDGVMEQARANLAKLEEKTGRRFGGSRDPLLVSVRSGSAMSMPGMMDTILNLGLNEDTLAGLIRHTGNERFGYDAWRRFIQLFGKVALGVPDKLFDEAFEAVKAAAGVKLDVALSADQLREAAGRFLEVVERHTGRPFPSDPYEQLEIAIKAVFGSWMGKRAVDYRREFHITPEMANGTAVNVVTMVFGNMGNDSATGVGFTRNPGTGENELYGEYLVNAQGEDVVAGIRTPKGLKEMAEEMPDMYAELLELRDRLERHYREVQDFEFTVERGRLYCLQTRNGKMNAAAMVRTSVEMHEEELITQEQAITRPATPMPWLPGCRPLREPQPARRCSTPTGPRHSAARAPASCWSARKPSPRTSTASSQPRGFSPAGAGRPPMRRSLPGGWASRAWPAPKASTWTCRCARLSWVRPLSPKAT